MRALWKAERWNHIRRGPNERLVFEKESLLNRDRDRVIVR